MLLPIHPLLRQQELLSSWMVRLAIANDYGIHTFYRKIAGYDKSIWTRDIDRNPSEALLDRLKQLSGYGVAELYHHTLHRYIGSVFTSISSNGYQPLLLPIGVYHRKRRRMGLQYCPQCLRDDHVTYFRQSWRLAFFAICEKHHCLLVSRCPGCQNPIMFHRFGIGNIATYRPKFLAFCSECGERLSDTHGHKINWPDKRSWKLYLALLHHFEDGKWRGTDFGTPHMVLVFRGFHAILQVLIGRSGELLQRIIGRRLFGDDYNYGPIRAKDFELLNAQDRLIAMLFVMWLIWEWPDRWVNTCNEAGITRSCFSERLSSLPFWLFESIDLYLTKC